MSGKLDAQIYEGGKCRHDLNLSIAANDRHRIKPEPRPTATCITSAGIISTEQHSSP